MTKLVTIVIPVRAEAENIGATVGRLVKHVHTPHTILIVDDHITASDTTRDAVARLQKRFSGIELLVKKPRDTDGFGPALSRAVDRVRTPYTVFVMGDGCDDPTLIDTMVRRARTSGADVIAGSRYSPGGKKVGGPWLQHICSTMLNTCLSVIGMPTRDGTNAFKLYRTSFLRSILPVRPLRGVEFSLQLSLEGLKKHGRYLDIPTTWRGRTKGTSKIRLVKSGLQYQRLFFRILRLQLVKTQ